MKSDELIQRWREEFARGGIPSSYKSRPSSSVEHFAEFLQDRSALTGRAIDIGCGLGRNALYLASRGIAVTAIDFLDDALVALDVNSEKLSLRDKITTVEQDIVEPWPFPNENFDIAIDTFCFRHLIAKCDREHYVRELARVLKPRAYFLLTLSSDQDGYYRQFSRPNADDRGLAVLDPVTGIRSLLYSADDIGREFGEVFEIELYQNYQSDAEMHGKRHRRNSHRFIFSRSQPG